MSISNQKIIAFEPHQAKANSDNHRKEKIIIDECWSLISEQLNQRLPSFFSRLEDNLFRMSEKAETNAQATLFFDAMRYVRSERGVMETQYRQALKRIYEEYWSEAVPKTTDKEGFSENGEERDFDLMEDGVLEESLAVYGMIEKGNNLYQLELFSLAQRFYTLLGEEREVRILPISPYAICKQFEILLQSLAMDLKVKLFIYKIFDRQILSNLGQMYQDLNSHLVVKGVLPSIARNLRRYGPSETSPQSSRQRTENEDAKDALAYLDVFRMMQSLMEAWRNKSAEESSSDAGMSEALPVDTAEVLGAINSLQFSSEREFDSSEAVSPEQLKHCIALQVEKLKGDNQARALSRTEEDIIDMVGILFDYILDDKSISTLLKCPIARLQIPIIKVAIIDKSFFSKKNHPARALLNTLAKTGVGLGSAELDDDNPIIRKVEMIVGRVIHEFDQCVGLFAELLEDLTEFLNKDSQRSQVNEDRTRKVTQSKEKLWIAKKRVAYELTSRLKGKDTPAAFRTFLYNEWKDVLVLAYLQQDKMDGEWERSLQITDQMIWSIIPPADALERKQIIQAIPTLVRTIKQRLEGISLDSHQIAMLIGELEVCHVKSLRLATPALALQQSAQPPNQTDPLATDEVRINDEELVDALSEINAQLPDISSLEVEEVIVGDVGTNSHKAMPDKKTDYAQGVFMEWVNRLNEGDWIEFIEEDERAWRAKLSCKSAKLSLCIFVNRRGVKVLELKNNELASRLREGKARVIEDYKTPIMDRALTFLMQSLKKPFANNAQSCESS